MGQSTPIRMLYCSKCKAKWQREYALSHFSPELRKWFNVMVVEARGDKALIRCFTCGHEYESQSRAARRELAHFKKRKGLLTGE
ncbi:hypothetical protein [Marinobacter sp.]|uniref:hypothetical protein n=1 Tax=Marinobacter sp. TaxID=50741 RepID=UPI00260D9541|nr:hypothetical protein [Marinobacter sp.]